MRVPPEGVAVLPGTGGIRAAGRGVEELSREIALRLEEEERLIEPRVVVSVVSYGSRRAFLYGAIASARSVELPPEAAITLIQAVASCGGFGPDADRARVRVTRRGRRLQGASVTEVDARRIAEARAPELDPVLEPGDTVYVPRREPVYILGQVTRQGAIPVPFEYPLTVSKAVAVAGGFTPFARYSRVRVTRRTPEGVRRFTVNVGDILTGGDLDKDMELLPGDTVYVPERVF